MKYYFHIKWYNGIYGTWLSLHNLYLLALFMKYWVIDIFMILLEDCPRASFIESRYGKLYKSCIKFWSMCWVHKHNTLCIHGILILNQICIKLVNFTLKTLKISAEYKKKRNWNSMEFYIKSDIFHPFVQQVLSHGLVQAQGIMEMKCPLKISLQLLQDETPTWCTIFLPPWICFVMTVILYLKIMPEWC